MKKIHVTNKMNGKMKGFVSINTSPMNNKYCKALAKTDAVCGSCYSVRMMKMYKNADACFQRNGDALSESLLDDQEIPRFNAHTVRFHAHGELINGLHMANLILICRANPRTAFTLWTKRVDLVQKVLRDYPKPANLILIRSSVQINVIDALPPGFDKVFTVYDKTHKGLDFINCGAKPCADCMTCYTIGDTTQQIHEVVK